VGGSGKTIEMFQKMPENNSKYMSTVYLKAEELFDQVHAVK